MKPNNARKPFGAPFALDSALCAGEEMLSNPGPDRVGDPLWDLLYAKKCTTQGVSFWARRPLMPRVPDDLLHCSVFLYPSVDDARAGEKAGGSGFLIQVNSATFPATGYGYVVTNAHVVRDCASPVVRINSADGHSDVFPLTNDSWILHPDGDDLAIAQVNPGQQVHLFRAVKEIAFLTPETMALLKIGPGDDVYQIGRFINCDGIERNLPTVRCGTIAMMPLEPLTLHTGHRQECFLIECHTIPGYSGSPVFLNYSHYRNPVDGEIAAPSQWH